MICDRAQNLPECRNCKFRRGYAEGEKFTPLVKIRDKVTQSGRRMRHTVVETACLEWRGDETVKPPEIAL